MIDDYISEVKGIRKEFLDYVEVYDVGRVLESHAKKVFSEGKPFDNAFNMACSDGCDVVVGYLLLPRSKSVIEHAWNADPQFHFDLNYQIFWSRNEQYKDAIHIQIARFNESEARNAMSKIEQLSFDSFMSIKSFREMFN